MITQSRISCSCIESPFVLLQWSRTSLLVRSLSAQDCAAELEGAVLILCLGELTCFFQNIYSSTVFFFFLACYVPTSF